MDDERRATGLRRNAVLSGLPPGELAAVAGALEVVDLCPGEALYARDRPLDAAWFPLGCVLSITADGGGDGIELGTVGDEGMLGVFLFLGEGASPNPVVAQLPGPAARMEAERYRRALDEHPGLRQQVQRWAGVMYVQLLQNVVCNRRHRVEERTSRWLLMTADRVHRDEFPLTQGSLARMLGVRRATVTVAAGELQDAGLIRYRRGQVALVDRGGLRALACGCYEVIRREFDRLRQPART